MSHISKIKDTDPFFIIEPITRAMKNVSGSKTTVIQHDHNSERFTFELPRYIEGHDMMECNLIEVHYENGSEKGIYIVDDLAIVEGEENKLKCTWLLSQNATSNVAALKFLLRFSCVQTDGTVDYAWNTAPYAGITVSTGLYNTDYIEKTHPDFIAELIARIDRIVVGGGGAVDLSNYFTKDETTQMIDFGTLNANGYTDSEIKLVLNVAEKSSNKVNKIDVGVSPENYPTVAAVLDFGLSIESSAINYVENKVGDIESALDELHNYAKSLIGGDAS